MLSLKSGVKAAGIQPELLLAITVADQVYSSFSVLCVITALTDGKHSVNSLHYKGKAVDLRCNNTADDAKIVAELKARLGLDYDVILEGAGTLNEHIHLEFQPK